MEAWKLRAIKKNNRNVVISIEEYRHLVENSTFGESLLDKIEHFAEYVQSEAKKGYRMIDVEICGAILGFEVNKDGVSG